MSSGQSGANTSRSNYGDDWQPNDPYADDGASEFSWGDGLTPRHLRTTPPSEGGVYQGTSPPSGPQEGVSRR
jgi:hypothetical protein